MRIINGDQWDIIHRPIRDNDPVLEHVADQAAAAARAAVVPAGSIITVSGTGSIHSVLPSGLLDGTGMQVLRQTVTFDEFTKVADGLGDLVLDGVIPAGAWALRTTVTNVTGFTGDTSAALTVGDGSDVDRYNTSTLNVVSNVTAIDGGAISGTAIHTTAVDTVTVSITSASDWDDVVAGEATINIFYLL